MCICGGIIEAGIICGIIGCIGKIMNKCKCKCHEQSQCSHCNHEQDKIKSKKSKIYKFVQIFFHFLIIFAIICFVTHIIVKHHVEHEKNCSIEKIIHE